LFDQFAQTLLVELNPALVVIVLTLQLKTGAAAWR